MENLEVKEVAELALESGQLFDVKKGAVFAGGALIGVVACVVIPRLVRRVKNGFAQLSAKRAARKAAKMQVEEQEENA